MTIASEALTPAADSAIEATRITGDIVERYGEPAWLAAQRRRAWEIYASAPAPDRVNHLWRYTDPAPFALTTGDLLPADDPTAEEDGQKSVVKEHLDGYAVWHSDHFHDLHIDPRLAQAGVILMDLHQAAHEHAALVEKHLGSAVLPEHGKFEALNAAIWQAGIFLYVPRGVVVEQPIHVLLSGHPATPHFAPRLLLVLEEGAELTLVDEFTSPRDARLSTNTVVETVVGANAHLRRIIVQRWGEQVVSHFTHRALLERDSQFLAVWAGLGAGVSKVDMRTALLGRGAHAKMLGMAFGQRQQHFDHHTVHDHRARDTYSDLDFKVVLKDQARSAYTGQIRIEQSAPNCEAYQENRNLLLSDGTRADTIPELEILTDEVRCSHGATIGPVDEADLFYLCARGIPRDEAMRMVVGGFVEPTLKVVPEDLRERLRAYVMERVREI